jgi:hypothetical protein
MTLRDARRSERERPPPVSIEDRKSVHEIVINLVGLVFECPGKYEFRFFANNELVESKTIDVIKAAKAKVSNEQSI